MAKPKITKTTTPKAPKTKVTRVDTTQWVGSSPLSGSGQSWSEWGKSNPNRLINAEARKKEFEKMPTTMTAPNSRAREEVVAKWKAARPISGSGGAKSEAEKEAKRQKQIRWAKHNPNKLSNANRALAQEKAKKSGKK